MIHLNKSFANSSSIVHLIKRLRVADSIIKSPRINSATGMDICTRFRDNRQIIKMYENPHHQGTLTAPTVYMQWFQFQLGSVVAFHFHSLISYLSLQPTGGLRHNQMSKITKVIRIHHLQTMINCTKIQGNSSTSCWDTLFQCGWMWWTNRLIDQQSTWLRNSNLFNQKCETVA